MTIMPTIITTMNGIELTIITMVMVVVVMLPMMMTATKTMKTKNSAAWRLAPLREATRRDQANFETDGWSRRGGRSCGDSLSGGSGSSGSSIGSGGSRCGGGPGGGRFVGGGSRYGTWASLGASLGASRPSSLMLMGHVFANDQAASRFNGRTSRSRRASSSSLAHSKS